MAENRVFRLRVTYRKSGRLAMLSHLEVTHALERMVRRARLPFALTQGFSPHMKISFGGALPVGVGGNAEIFDLYLDDYVAPAKALEALSAMAPCGMEPAKCEYVEPSAKAASVAFPFSMYEAVLPLLVSSISVPESIEVVRKKKAKCVVVADYLVEDPLIIPIDESDYAKHGGACDGGRAVVRFQLEAKDTGSLRPDVLLAECSYVANDGGVIRPGEIAPLAVTRMAISARPMGNGNT